MGRPCLSSCPLRQMSAVSAVISAQLNINDSLAWQVLAGQRRGERGTPLDKTRDEKENWWLYLSDGLSFVSLNLRICMCAISRFLVWHDGFIALFIFPSKEMLPYSHSCSSFLLHCWHSFKSLCVLYMVLCIYIAMTTGCGPKSWIDPEGRLVREKKDGDQRSCCIWSNKKLILHNVISKLLSSFMYLLQLSILLWFSSVFLPNHCGHSFHPLALAVVTQACSFFSLLSFELLTPHLSGVNGYCWADT